MSNNYGTYPKAVFSWEKSLLTYVIISYYGNTTATSGTITSTSLYGTTYTSPDLSLNTLYTFKISPYNTSNEVGYVNTITVDTTPKSTGVYLANVTTESSAQIQWYGNYDYVKMSRASAVGSSGTLSAYTDVSLVVVSMPYYDKDLSGNTKYSYYVTPYFENAYTTASNAITVYTNVQAAKDLSYTFLDSSAVTISFTEPKNSYTSSYSYTLTVYNTTLNYTQSATGTSSPLFVQNLSSGTDHKCYIITKLDNDTSLTSTSTSYSITTTTVDNSTYYSFKNIYSIATYTTSLSATYATYGVVNGVQVSADKTKMLISYNNGLYYSTYSSGSWSTPVSLLTTTVSYPICMALSLNGKYGIVGKYNTTGLYLLTWTGSIPILSSTAFDTSISCNKYNSIAITPDGTKAAIISSAGGLYFTTYSSTNSTYNALTTITSTASTANYGIALTSDGTYLFFSSSTYIYYYTWNGSTYATKIQFSSNSKAYYGLCIVGGGLNSGGGTLIATADINNNVYYSDLTTRINLGSTYTYNYSGILPISSIGYYNSTGCNVSQIGCSDGKTLYYGYYDTGAASSNVFSFSLTTDLFSYVPTDYIVYFPLTSTTTTNQGSTGTTNNVSYGTGVSYSATANPTGNTGCIYVNNYSGGNVGDIMSSYKAFTYSCWIKVGTQSTSLFTYYLGYNSSVSQKTGLGLAYWNSGPLPSVIKSTDTNSTNSSSGTSGGVTSRPDQAGTAPYYSYTNGLWHHYVAVFDAYNKCCLYMNGFFMGYFVNIAFSPLNDASFSTGMNAFLGSPTDYASNGTAYYYDFKIYNRQLSYREIQSLYYSTVSQNWKTTGLVAFLPFNTTPDYNVPDLLTIFYDYYGTCSFTPYGIPTVTNNTTRGYVLTLNGSTQYLITNLYLQSTFSRGGWFYITSSSTGNTLIASTNAPFYLVSSYITAQVIISGTTYSAADTTAISSRLNSWVHIMNTFDGASLILYINGSAVATTNTSGTWSGDTNLISIGALNTANYFTGYMDNLRIYSTALTSTEVNTIYTYENTNKPK